MLPNLRARCAPGLHWWVRRNPMYLLSAASMAIGARLLLVSPDDSTGDVGLILLTLGALLFYEWCVTAVLLLLHRRRLSPEDEPSLLLVAALFWTGPLVATMEMSAQRAGAGIILAAGACAIALAEFHVAKRVMKWRFTWPAQLFAGACLVMIAAAQPLLKIRDEASGVNELLLYGMWWLFASIGLLAIPAIRLQIEDSAIDPFLPRRSSDRGTELAFLLVVVAATAAHLVAMNHAFFGHARPFYAAPLLIALAAAGMEWLKHQPTSCGSTASREERLISPEQWPFSPAGLSVSFGCGGKTQQEDRNLRRTGQLTAIAVLPAMAIWLATDAFHPDFPIERLPAPLRDPLLTVLLAAAAAWSFGYVRHRVPALMHVAALAMIAFVVRAEHSFGVNFAAAPSYLVVAGLSRTEVALGLYAATTYLCIVACLRRSRLAAVAALTMHQVALTLLLWSDLHSDVMITFLTAGWTALLALHVAARRPPWVLRLVPIVFLTAVCWSSLRDPALVMAAKTHLALVVVFLVICGQLLPWTRYRTMAAVLLLGYAVPTIVHWITHNTHGLSTATVVAGFLLLAVGAWISWNKSRLLHAARSPNKVIPDGDHRGE